MTMKKTMLTAAVVLAVPGLATAWHEPAPPSDLVSVAEAGTFWPYTGRDYSGSPTDPINLVFLGDVDPRLIRQTLLALDGDRSAEPRLAGFDCTWRDAIGRPQTSYSGEAGWQGSAVQLECGDYATLRAHLRLFRQDGYTLGGAHLEVQIPGTSEHEVLSWVIPRELVAFDIVRSGFLLDLDSAPSLTQVPSWRTIRHQVLNGLPDALREALGLPTGELTEDVPIPNDGAATVLTLWGQFSPTDSAAVVEFDHPFGQAIPKPFCSGGPGDWLYVSGSVHMIHRVRTDADGRYASRFVADGTLQVVPINPLTGEFLGPPYLATVSEVYRSGLTDVRQTAYLRATQVLWSDPAQWFFEALWAGRVQADFSKEHCGY